MTYKNTESDQIVCGNHGSDIVIRHKGKPCPLCVSRQREQALLQLLVNQDVLPIVPEDHSWGIVPGAGPLRLHVVGPNAMSGLSCIFSYSDVEDDEEDSSVPDPRICKHPPFEDILLPEPVRAWEMGQRKST